MTQPSILPHPAATPTVPHAGGPVKPADRRASVRHACDLEVLSHSLEQSDALCWGATVQDVSEGGLGLRVCYPFKAGTRLTVEVHTAAGSPRTVAARVVHAQDLADGTWLVGCELTPRLSPDELAELL